MESLVFNNGWYKIVKEKESFKAQGFSLKTLQLKD